METNRVYFSVTNPSLKDYILQETSAFVTQSRVTLIINDDSACQ